MTRKYAGAAASIGLATSLAAEGAPVVLHRTADLSVGGADGASLNAPGLQAIALNSFVQARVRIARELELGANIDLFGYGFGSSVGAERERQRGVSPAVRPC